MCNGCEHEAACAALKLIDLSPERSPCFEPAGFTSVLDELRKDVSPLPNMLQYLIIPAPEPVYQ